MKYKYNKNLDLFIRHSKTVSDCRVVSNRELNEGDFFDF
tara:strand:- start:99 stop:215 length:117 start_codon:yes stop_codon:yes gene_type:complete